MEFNNTSGVRSPFSPRVRQSITGRRAGISSIKKNQSKYLQSANEHAGEIIYKTPQNTIETFGTPLPVMVTEALTFASGSVSVRMSSYGWCWAVCGRRVLCWPYSPSISSVASARELTLPQTDLAHKADLVLLYYQGNAQMPSCVGVSPEGVVRYWASVGQESVFLEQVCELQGQECERLVSLDQFDKFDQSLATGSPETLVLATTTCTVVLITTNHEDAEGRPSVSCRPLRPPSGWLGGLGRRVSLLFFGSMPAQTIDTRLVGMSVLRGEDGWVVALVARGPLLQLWSCAGGAGEPDAPPPQDLHEHDLRRQLANAMPELGNIEIVVVDVCSGGPSSLLLLLHYPHGRYALGHVDVEQVSAPRVTSLVPLQRLPPVNMAANMADGAAAAGDADAGSRLRMVNLGASVMLYTATYVAIASSSVAEEKMEVVELDEGDRVVGAGGGAEAALLFSVKHGLALLRRRGLARSPHDRSVCESPPGSPCPSDLYDGNLSLYEIDPHEVGAAATDAAGKVKTAFLFHLRRDAGAAAALLHAAFPAAPPAPAPAPAPAPDVDAALDVTLLGIALEMLDDIPAGDPRWKQPASGAGANIPLGSSAALQTAAQLQDKRRAFSLFVDFLRATGLWQRLGYVTREGAAGGAVSTAAALAALAERLAVAQALCALHRHPDCAPHVDAAIREVVAAGPQPAEGALAPADVAFRRVSRAPALLAALARRGAADALQLLHVAGAVTSVMAEVHKCRAQWARGPGAAADGALADALLTPFLHLHKKIFALARALPAAEGALRARLLERGAGLARAALREAAPPPPRRAPLYRRLRRDFIQPFVDEEQYERAADLAETFGDFQLLIELCVKTDDFDKLFEYTDKYTNEGLLETACAWLADGGARRRAQLVARVGPRYAARLRAWLAGIESRTALLALHELNCRRHAEAAEAFADLAVAEYESLNRMTTAASLAKLCALAAGGAGAGAGARRAEARLALGAHHAAVPRALRRRHGALPAGADDDCAVQAPEDLLHMYIASEGQTLTEYDFKKALDLTEFIEDMEKRDDLRLRVWCASIKHDDWSTCRMDSPADVLQDKLFFRVIDLVQIMGGDLELVLPPLEDILTAPELADLLQDDKIHFSIKYGYECVERARADADGAAMET